MKKFLMLIAFSLISTFTFADTLIAKNYTIKNKFEENEKSKKQACTQTYSIQVVNPDGYVWYITKTYTMSVEGDNQLGLCAMALMIAKQQAEYDYAMLTSPQYIGEE